MTAPKVVASSKEALRVRIDVDSPPGTQFDPTDDTVEMAFTLNDADPGDDDFIPAQWETNATVNPPVFYAACVVGPDTLTAGNTYTVFVRITDSPEVPIKWCGTVVAV